MLIRLAYVIDSIASPTGGTERQLLLLIRGLDRCRFEPFLCCLRSSEWLEREWRDCQTHVVGIDSFRSLGALVKVFKLAWWFRRNRIHVVQTHFRDATITGLLAAKLAGVPVIIGSRRGRPLYSSVLGKLLFRFLNRIPNAFVTNSKYSRDLAVREEKIDPDRFAVIHNILDQDSFLPRHPRNRQDALDKLATTGEFPVIGIVANLNPWKRHDLLLQAAAILANRGLCVQIVCIGGGDADALMTTASKLGLGGRVLAMGTRHDVPTLLPAFDVGVLCSDFESSSNALLEYIAAGVPVVSTAVGGCVEAVEEGSNGYLVPPGDPTALALALEKALKGGICPKRQADSRATLLAERKPVFVVNAHLRAYGLEG